jgi:hypothetical protein
MDVGKPEVIQKGTERISNDKSAGENQTSKYFREARLSVPNRQMEVNSTFLLEICLQIACRTTEQVLQVRRNS